MSGHHSVAGFGNPLLDMSIIGLAKGTLNSILIKYNLNPDDQKEIDCVELNEMISLIERENCEIIYNPGGCVLNTLRIIQALVQQSSYCTFFGGLGSDEQGELLETEVMKSGVEARFTKQPSHPTGRVVALINGESRSLVAHLGAAQYYRIDDFQAQENVKLFQEVSVVYIEGFFITHSLEVGLEVTRLCETHGVTVLLNISGAYVAENFPEELLAMASAADLVIGNANELKALAKVMDLKCDDVLGSVMEVHSKLWTSGPSQKLKLEIMKQFGKTLVITQGKDPILCVYGKGNTLTYNVPLLNPGLIKDSTGAGDAFVAGFITALLKNTHLFGCLEYGCKIAQQVIQHTGVQPEKLANL